MAHSAWSLEALERVTQPGEMQPDRGTRGIDSGAVAADPHRTTCMSDGFCNRAASTISRCLCSLVTRFGTHFQSALCCPLAAAGREVNRVLFA